MSVKKECLSTMECPKIGDKKFTFTWKIVNFSLCSVGRGKSIDSKPFTVYCLNNTEWYLKLYPKGDAIERFLSCYLCRKMVNGDSEFIAIHFLMYLMDCNGKVYISREFHTESFGQNDACGLVAFKRKDELFKVKNLLLPNDTLTVCCDIFDSAQDVQCSAWTYISAERYAFTWDIEKFSVLEHHDKVHYSLPSVSGLSTMFEMAFYVTGGSTLGEIGQIEIFKITRNDNRSLASVCKIGLLDARGKTSDYAEDEYLFRDKENPVWRFPPFIQRRTLMENKDTLLPNDVLSLRCEFAISTGEVMDNFETKFGHAQNTFPKAEDSSAEQIHLLDLLGEVYAQNTCCDVILRARDGKIPAHRLILCAWSSVFHSLLDNVKNGTINIPDMDLSTLNAILTFMYTENLEGLNWPKAVRLYSLACKYKITGLKVRCLGFLKSNISAENVYEIMALAENCQDMELKTTAYEYVCANASEMLLSDEWKHFMRCKVQLATDNCL